MSVLSKGARIEKINTVPGKDTHRDGAQGTVADVLGPYERSVGYFVEWDDLPGVPVFIAGDRVRAINSPRPQSPVVHRSMLGGDEPCVCGDLRREHVGGREGCDKCDCQRFAAVESH